ncbi:MAG: ATP-dependent sacrificial sulfur transferase LarE [Thermoplasmata archaeon]|nr:ATP-dependent sacrificial sulfur transferase LarE [Thermoplasmata archaeon]
MPPHSSGKFADAPEPPSKIVEWFRAGPPPLVALSGGVDSAAAATLARDAWGERAVAVTLTGPAISARETSRAREVAREIGIELVELPVDSMSSEGYRSNPSDRCYFCRSTETSVLRTWGDSKGISRYVDGVHLDDLGEDRPGLRAMAEAGFEHPLLWARWRKSEVRNFARERDLPNWDQPSDACLASRIRHGQPITVDGLRRVERAESFLTDLGFRRVRVRVDDGAARVEVDPEEVPRLELPEVAEATRSHLLRLGFREVRIDPHGYAPRPGA